MMMMRLMTKNKNVECKDMHVLTLPAELALIGVGFQQRRKKVKTKKPRRDCFDPTIFRKWQEIDRSLFF